MNISTQALLQISNKINNGYPITALATANNYLTKSCPIRTAIAAKVREKIALNSMSDKNQIVFKILEGQTVSEQQLLSSIEQYDRGSYNLRKFIPKNRLRSHLGRRYASRVR